MHRCVFAERQHQGKRRQSAEGPRQSAAAAKRGQHERDHARAHVHAVAERQSIEARLADDGCSRKDAVGIAHRIGECKLDQAQGVQRTGFRDGASERRRPLGATQKQAGRHDHDRTHTERKHHRGNGSHQPARAGQRRIAPACGRMKNKRKKNAETGADHGEKNFAKKHGKDRGQRGLDQTAAPGRSARTQTVEQGDVPDGGPGHPRIGKEQKTRGPLSRGVARERPSQTRDEDRFRRTAQAPGQKTHAGRAPRHVRETLPVEHAGHPARPDQCEKPVGRIEDPVERIAEDGKTEPLVGIPARQFAAPQRFAQKSTRGIGPVRDVAKEQYLA